MVKINIDEKLLAELGITGLNGQEQQALIAQLYRTLQQRVGLKIASRLDDKQLAEFETLADKSDDASTQKLLAETMPDYADIVSAEFEQLKKDIRQDTDRVLQQLKPDK